MYELLEKLCKDSGISITKLCLDITGSKGNLPTWKKGNINPVSLLKIADYFNVTVDYLLGRTNYPNAIVKSNGYVMKENTIENNSNNGDNIINNSSVSSETDEMTSELIKRFSNLSFDEKIEVFNYIKNIK